MRPRRGRLALLAALLLPLALWWGNRDIPPAPQARPTLLAHRGIAQRFDERGLDNDTCTAQRMLPPQHALLENTLPSIRASFEAGADVVEIDVHPTTDGQFAVFHDWRLECRTEGKGETGPIPWRTSSASTWVTATPPTAAGPIRSAAAAWG